MKYRRCPNGTRKNKKEDCIDNIGNIIIQREDRIITEAEDVSNSSPEEPPPVSSPPKEPEPSVVKEAPDSVITPPNSDELRSHEVYLSNKTHKTRARYCPKGSRRNRQGKCVTRDGIEVPEIGEMAEFPSDKQGMKVPPPQLAETVEVVNRKTKRTGMNAFLAEKERMEYSRNKDTTNTETQYNDLYPEFNDPLFNIKIAHKKEFQETKFDDTIYNIVKQSDEMCESKFELMPHQLFVKNFLSINTPYNSLLLYHGLGTGKTCSAIGVAEEMRRYMSQVGIRDKIIVVASPNVQGNFRSQLFDETKLVQVVNATNPEEYTWNIESCVGDSLLREINPNSVRNMPREKIVSNIQAIINTWYEFMGYGQLANYIVNKTKVGEDTGFTVEERKAMELNNIRAVFNNKCIIIDEVHNISQTEDNKHKTTGTLLMQVAKYAKNMRLLLLSATPMFDTYKEIIWLTNLMNANDKRSLIDATDVFDPAGNFKESAGMDALGNPKESGKELLIRKLTGYVSYVRGENPYTFPFRVYPDVFSKEHTFFSGIPYPEIQVNDKPVPTALSHIKVYLNTIASDSYQMMAYKYIVNSIKKNARNAYDDLRDLNNFDILQKPIECLNMVYPHAEFEKAIQKTDILRGDGLITVAIGENGLNHIMTYQEKGMKNQFEYKSGVVEKYGRVFSPNILSKYSKKIANICEIIRKSDGIVLIYSQYIDGGVVPIALALEEMGFAKYSSSSQNKSLFRKPPCEPLDATTMLPKSQVPEKDFHQATYIMITGDKLYSPTNTTDIAYAKQKENRDGSRVKVVIISKAGSEGLDFKHIRQIHIVEPWFNMNRIEQIIGRGVRNLSHCALPFPQRNVQIYLHGTVFEGEKEEAVDLYVYRIAEKKALQIGKVSRVLKTIATDCLLNVGQTNMTAEKLMTIAENQKVEIKLSTKETIPFRVGDQPFTDICDYMDTCDYTCSPTKEIAETDIRSTTYSESFAQSNVHAVSKRIRDLFRENHIYKRNQLIRAIQITKTYPIEHIYYALSLFVQNKQEYVVDKYERIGYLENRGEYYVFQPIEITDEKSSIFERSVPVDYKRDRITLVLPQRGQFPENTEISRDVEVLPEILDQNRNENTRDITVRSDDAKALIEQVIAMHSVTENPTKMKGLDKDWYKNCSNVLQTLMEEYHISKEQLSMYIVTHCLDEMTYANKMTLVTHFYSVPGNLPQNAYEKMIVAYFDEKRIQNETKNKMGILLANKTEVVLSVRSLDDTAPQWIVAEEDDIKYFKNDLAKYNVSKSRLNRIIGYIVDFKDKEMIFKFKDITLTRNKLGARCDSAGKADIIKMLNMVIDGQGTTEKGTTEKGTTEKGTTDNAEKEVYTQENTAELYQPRLCVILEILLREYTRTNRNNRVYFLTPEQSIVGEITRYTTSK
jgi:hypothetical protein